MLYFQAFHKVFPSSFSCHSFTWCPRVPVQIEIFSFPFVPSPQQLQCEGRKTMFPCPHISYKRGNKCVEAAAKENSLSCALVFLCCNCRLHFLRNTQKQTQTNKNWLKRRSSTSGITPQPNCMYDLCLYWYPDSVCQSQIKQVFVTHTIWIILKAQVTQTVALGAVKRCCFSF